MIVARAASIGYRKKNFNDSMMNVTTGAGGDVLKWAVDVRQDLLSTELMDGIRFADGEYVRDSDTFTEIPPLDVAGNQPDPIPHQNPTIATGDNVDWTDGATPRAAAAVFIGGTAIVHVRPALKELQDDLEEIHTLALQRFERDAEIHEQVEDILPYFGAVLDLKLDKHPYTIQLLELAIGFSIACHMQMKHRLNVPRPSTLDPQVQPMIPVPGHGSCPSGHATESRMVEKVFGFFLTDFMQGANGAYLTNVQEQFARHAERIAENRIVAGLHYSVDNDHGAALADQLAAHFWSRMTGRVGDNRMLGQLLDKAAQEWA